MVLLIQHALQDSNGLSEDRYVNTFHALELPLGGEYEALALAVRNFYLDTDGIGTNNIRTYMANHAWGDNATVKIYELDDAEPRQPVYEEVYDHIPQNSASVALPSEVSSCISFSAPPAAGVPMARRRGRIYIGPLNVDAVEVGGSSLKSRPKAVFMEVACRAFRNLATTMFEAGYAMMQYSPTSGVASAPSVCWMDDAWDTQRRRGVAPTGRFTEPIV